MLEETGSFAYKSPEMIKHESYTEVVDIWAAGCVLYQLISGKHPFYADKVSLLKENICGKELDMSSEEWVLVSESAKNLI